MLNRILWKGVIASELMDGDIDKNLIVRGGKFLLELHLDSKVDK